MKKIILPILIIAFLASAFRIIYKRLSNDAAPTAAPSTKARFSKKLLDVGDKIIKSPVEGKFEIINTGSRDLLIADVSPDCHCTGATFPKTAIKPNDSAEIVLKYNSSIPGIFQSSASVTTNTPDSPTILIFRGNVVDTSKRKN